MARKMIPSMVVGFIGLAMVALGASLALGQAPPPNPLVPPQPATPAPQLPEGGVGGVNTALPPVLSPEGIGAPGAASQLMPPIPTNPARPFIPVPSEVEPRPTQPVSTSLPRFGPADSGNIGQVWRTPTSGAVGDDARPQAGLGRYLPPGQRVTTTPTPGRSLTQPFQPAAATRPFSNYRPRSPVSPYQNLFREGTSAIENYYTLVRPQIEAQREQQQFQQNLQNLLIESRTQQTNLRQLDQRTNEMRGVPYPSYYMNYSPYYPGISR